VSDEDNLIEARESLKLGGNVDRARNLIAIDIAVSLRRIASALEARLL